MKLSKSKSKTKINDMLKMKTPSNFRSKSLLSNCSTISNNINNIHTSKIKRLSISSYETYLIKEKIKHIKKKINFYTVSNIKHPNELIDTTKSFSVKKSLLSSLREELNYHKNITDQFLAYEKYTNDLCTNFQKNYDDICKYKSNLVNDLKDFINLMQSYEERRQNVNKEKMRLIKINEDIVKYKLEEQEKLKKKLNSINDDLETQKEQLNEINKIYGNSAAINDRNMKNLEKEELINSEKYSKLEESYKRVLNKYNYYKNLEFERKQQKYLEQSLGNELKNNIDLKLKDRMLKNDYLKNVISDIKEKIREIESARKIMKGNSRSREDTKSKITRGSKFSRSYSMSEQILRTKSDFNASISSKSVD